MVVLTHLIQPYFLQLSDLTQQHDHDVQLVDDPIADHKNMQHLQPVGKSVEISNRFYIQLKKYIHTTNKCLRASNSAFTTYPPS